MLSPEELKAADLLSAIADDLDVLLFVLAVECDNTLRFVAVTGDALKAAGANGAIAGTLLRDALPASATARLQEHAELALATGSAQSWTSEETWPLGRRVFHVTLTPTDGGTRLAGVAHDITNHHNALCRAERRDQLSQAMFEGIPAEAAVLDGNGTIIAVNDAWARLAATDPATATPGDDFVASLAPAIGQGVRSVLDGSAPEFQTDIEEGDRWTSLRATRIVLEDTSGVFVLRVDITDRVANAKALEAMFRTWNAAFRSSALAMVLLGRDGTILRTNRRAVELFDRDRKELTGMALRGLIHPEDQEAAVCVGRSVFEHDRPSPPTELRFLRPDGSVSWGLVAASTTMTPAGEPGLYLQITDVTDRRAADDRLADYHRLVELVASGAPIGVVLHEVARCGQRHVPGSHWIAVARTDDLTVHTGDAGSLPDRFLHEVTAHLTPLLGTTLWQAGRITDDLGEVDGTLGALCHDVGFSTAWTTALGSNGEAARGGILVLGAPQGDHQHDRELTLQLASVARIALARDEATTRLARSALEDGLTGLANRAAWWSRLAQARDHVGRSSTGFAVLVANLDDMRRTNEMFGYAVGDAVIIEAARRARAAMRPQDVVARGGGDEILVLLDDVASVDEARVAGERLVAAIRRTEPDATRVTTSVGAAVQLSPNLLTDPERDAAMAMHLAKASGGDRLEVFHEGMRTTAVDRIAREHELRTAIEQRQLVVHYQPDIDLRTGTVLAVEALVRWQHPTRGLLQPADFIELAEDSGLIVPLGLHVLEQSCIQLAAWRAAGHRVTMAVNLSTRQLGDSALVGQVAALVATHGLDPRQLLFEITESTLVEDVDRAAEVIAGLRALGAKLAIDDFGTGYSSLLYLKRFHVDALKIDRSFVNGLGTDAGDTAIVAAVVRLAHTLDLTVIAEGVELPEQLRHLQRLGCDSAQGFLWSRPVPAEELDELLTNGVPDIAAGGHAGDDQVDDLLAVLTHELSTPLTVIGGYAEMLNRRVDDSDDRNSTDLRSGLHAIERNVDNLTRLVEALVGARGLGSPGEVVDVELPTLVELLLQDLAPLLAEHGVALRLSPETPPVRVDPVGVRQIITNLVGNAVKFAPQGTTIDIVVGSQLGLATVQVADHGPGVPVDRQHELFGRFARLGSMRKGLGLGLHLSRLIARRFDGDLRHEPTPGGGATFVLELPVAQ